jgi:RNA polymerase sigma-54 factor
LPDEGFDFDAVAAGALSLHDHLVGQAGELLEGIDRLVAHRIIDAIDDAGYLTEPVDDLARQLGLELSHIERVLTVIQSFDPSGVGARNLAECLAIQAREVDRYDPCMAALLDHLDLLARGQLPQLRRICNVDEEDLTDMIRELRNYDPKPGLKLN